MNKIQLTPEHMQSYVQDNPTLVTCKTQLNGLKVLKYHNRVFYKNLWTPELIECRGTVIDDEYNIIQRPFTKIFNLHERDTKIHRDTLVTATTKVNGFMGAVTLYHGKPLVSTTGSLDSEFADMAYDMLSKTNAFELVQGTPDVTWIYEIVHPSDPHIVPETIGVHLLGCRRAGWNVSQHYMAESKLDVIGDQYDLMRPEWFRIPFGMLLQHNKTVTHEGFVCWDDNGYELKLKSPQYLVTKFLARIRDTKFMNILENKPELLKERVDEEFYPLIDHIMDMGESFAELKEQSRIGLISHYIETELTDVR